MKTTKGTVRVAFDRLSCWHDGIVGANLFTDDVAQRCCGLARTNATMIQRMNRTPLPWRCRKTSRVPGNPEHTWARGTPLLSPSCNAGGDIVSGPDAVP